MFEYDMREAMQWILTQFTTFSIVYDTFSSRWAFNQIWSFLFATSAIHFLLSIFRIMYFAHLIQDGRHAIAKATTPKKNSIGF